MKALFISLASTIGTFVLCTIISVLLQVAGFRIYVEHVILFFLVYMLFFGLMKVEKSEKKMKSHEELVKEAKKSEKEENKHVDILV